MADVEQVTTEGIVEGAVAEGGAYEVIRARLVQQGRELHQHTHSLNQARSAEFGAAEMTVEARVRVRTENNCTARDIVQVGGLLLFGYTVFIGLKRETQVDDVFVLFRPVQREEALALEPVAQDDSFLADPRFVGDFSELYRYYKHTRLIQLIVHQGKLLAGFQIGERLEDIRVFRWALSADGQQVDYIDNRGERDIALPPSFDFEWTETTREDSVSGRHPHVNILDTVFVEAVGGDLTIKVEDNTEDGLGVYREPVDDQTQSLDDADIHFAKVGDLILVRVRPYREEQWRHLVFNTLTEQVIRIDALGLSCVRLPEDHGIIFPGGYYLQTGEHKSFDLGSDALRFRRMIRSPNGEDVLYIFYDIEDGLYSLIGYNVIDKSLQNPINSDGYALSDEGALTIFSAQEEPTRIHPMEIWVTPYVSEEFAARQPLSQTFCGRIGNASLVRGISDCFAICRLIDNQGVSARLYEELAKAARRMFDSHYWLQEPDAKELFAVITKISDTAELVIDEFEKVNSIRKQSKKAMEDAQSEQSDLMQLVQFQSLEAADHYVDALEKLRRQRGHLATVRELRYIDLEKLGAMALELEGAEGSVSKATVEFLAKPQALQPYVDKLTQLNSEVEQASTIVELAPHVEAIDATAAGLDLLSELMTTIKVEDTTLRTQIVDAISEVYAGLNQCRARARNKQKNVGTEEAIADFSAQFKLFSQSIVNALGLSTTPDRCDEQLSRLLIQLEELESQFSEYDQFLTDIVEKREEIYESFEARKQQLLDERQRKAQSVTDAAERIITSVVKRSGRFSDMDELNTFFSSDGLVVKTRELVEQLRELEAAVQADDIDARLKAARADAQRALRDSADLFEDGGNVIKLGPRHRFSVNTQELDLTIIPRNGELNLHLSGTNYFEPVADEELLALREYWGLALESESPHTYRGEYLASLILREAESGSGDASVAVLAKEAVDQSALAARCREFAAPRYKDGYERGIHDHDAALILGAFVPILMEAGPLRYGPLSRGLAQVFWAEKVLSEGKGGIGRRQSEDWIQRGQSAAQLRTALSSDGASELLRAEIEAAISAFLTDNPICESKAVIRSASEYLVAELARDRLDFVSSKGARRLCEELQAMLDDVIWRNYSDSLRRLEGHTTQRWHLATTWFDALIENRELNEYQQYVPEAVALTVTGQALGRREIELDLDVTVSGLLGEHALISNGALTFSLDGFLDRMAHHRHVTIPNYNRCQQVRQGLLTSERQSLRLDEFKPKPLSSFVRNKLIDECYLPIIGDNLAKQMGTVGESKRTDLMGLLMMISPPGYGKTTLMEYVASRLGLIFMKINCPSLGHDVLSLDPSQAPNATARQELMKVNLAFEMGNNVMLYLDDIQHTHPEFLQKFISLCDGTRRIEGVWKGDTKTYDLRGRKFCVVMAGNPYTESGEVFKIPDMLANRADIYNLGDVLGGMEAQFELSYIENSLTSNPVLAPLTNRDMKDVYKLVEMAQGGEVVTTDLLHQYSSAEVNEIVNVLGKMFVLRDVVLRVNQQYIASAAQDDKYRIEPPFKLQGSYRNMNKLAEKVSSVMEPGEMQQLLGDHYVGEAQLLTTGAEANLLKLAELREVLDNEEATRWTEIKRNFVRNLSIGGDDTDVGAKLVAQLVDLVGAVNSLQEAASVTEDSSMASREPSTDVKLLYRGIAKVGKLIAENRSSVEVINQPVPGMDKVLSSLADTIEHSFMPLVRHMDKKLEIDIGVHNKLEELANDMRRLRTQLPDPSANQRR